MPSYTITNQYGTALSATIEATDGTTALALYVGSQYVSTRKSEWIASLVRRDATIMADGSVAWESFRAVPSNRLAPVAVTIEPAAIDGIRCAIANGGSIELASDAECAAVYDWALAFVSDCEWREDDELTHEEAVAVKASMPAAMLVRSAARHYDGGMAAMVADAIADAKRADDATIGRCEHGALLAYCTAEHAAPMSSALAEARNCHECSQSLSWHYDGKPCKPIEDCPNPVVGSYRHGATIVIREYRNGMHDAIDGSSFSLSPGFASRAELEEWIASVEPMSSAPAWPIEELDLSVRPYNIIKRIGVVTIADLANLTVADVNAYVLANDHCAIGPVTFAELASAQRVASMFYRG